MMNTGKEKIQNKITLRLYGKENYYSSRFN